MIQTWGRTVLKDVNFNVKKGEIVGFAGLMGSGRTELALSIFGNPDGYRLSGEMFIKGEKDTFQTSRRMRSTQVWLMSLKIEKAMA